MRVEIDALAELKDVVIAAPWFKRPWLKWRLWVRLTSFLYRVDEHRNVVVRKELSAPVKVGTARIPTLRFLFWRSLRSATISFLVLPDRVFTATAAWMKLDFAVAPHDGVYLPDRFALSMTFDRLGRTERSQKTPNGGQEALIVAVAKGAAGISPLPGTVAGIRETEEWLRGRGLQVCKLIDEDATRDAVLNAWARASFVHVACHGVFEPDRPDASGLVMIPQTSEVDVISLRDLAQLDLGNLRHVTLSSCWGADSFVLPGRWIVSLPETLCRGGADSVLSCLWQIDDDVGKEFASRFNQYSSRMPRDKALRVTQQDCINNALLQGSRRTQDPFFWAGYRLHGKTSRLSF